MKYNMPILTIFFILLNILHMPASAHAQEAMFGLAMHGNAKYTAQSPHLDYANPNAPKGGTLKMSAIGTYDTLNPFTIKGVPAEGLELFNDRLMRRVWDEPFTMYPLIAQSIDLAPDRSWIRFHLNPKARFHDGSPITAQDVLFSFETLRDFGRPNMRRIYKLAKTATVENDHAIYFAFDKGFDKETAMIFAMMPVLSKSWWKDRTFDATLSEIPNASGPYKITQVDFGRKITYERVKDYWAADLLVNNGHFNFDQISYDYFRDDTIALQALKKGSISLRREMDIAKWENGYNDAPNVIKLAAPHQRPERAAGFVFNLRRPPFDDINVRKALALAFDYEWIGKNLFYGKLKPLSSFYANSALAAPDTPSAEELAALEAWKDKLSPEIFAPKTAQPQHMRQRLKTADDLLRKAGWVIENGKRVHAQTKTPFTFELLVNTPQDSKIANAYKSSLAKLGIEMNIRSLDSASFTERKMAYEFDMMSLFWQNSLSPGTEQTIYWSCTSAQQTGSLNYSGVCNPALDHFAAQIADAQDYESLKTAAHIIDRILMHETIMVPFFYKAEDYIAHQPDIMPAPVTPIYGVVTETWWSNTKKEN